MIEVNDVRVRAVTRGPGGGRFCLSVRQKRSLQMHLNDRFELGHRRSITGSYNIIASFHSVSLFAELTMDMSSKWSGVEVRGRRRLPF